MNSKAIVTIDTPVRYTNEITLHSVVRQGTIMGPILWRQIKLGKGAMLHMGKKSE